VDTTSQNNTEVLPVFHEFRLKCKKKIYKFFQHKKVMKCAILEPENAITEGSKWNIYNFIRKRRKSA
jgi:hypothetical protein